MITLLTLLLACGEKENVNDETENVNDETENVNNETDLSMEEKIAILEDKVEGYCEFEVECYDEIQEFNQNSTDIFYPESETIEECLSNEDFSYYFDEIACSGCCYEVMEYVIDSYTSSLSQDCSFPDEEVEYQMYDDFSNCIDECPMWEECEN